MFSSRSVTKTVVAAGFSTRYLEAGQAGKPQLVLIHDGGFGASADLCWGAIIDLLADEFHIFAPEMLGWGGTDKVVFLDRSPYAARLPHIAAFVDVMGIRSACFAGASFGGSLTMRASVTDGNPWRMERAISISGTGGPFRLQSGIDALAEYTPSMEAATKLMGLIIGDVAGFEEHIRQMHENSLIPGHWESMMAPRLRNPSADRSPPVDKYLEQLEHTRIPTLLVAGDHDPLLEARWADKLAARSELIEARQVDAGHEPNIDQPELVAGIMRDFFGSRR